MATDTTSGSGRSASERDVDRLDRRDLLVLKLELRRRRRQGAVAAAGQRATRSTR
jgi:hypothetical protein